ncbi:MAG: 16S rRNA (guanine(527)-N(7))-methyltransferase RsmG [Rothia sp. (in: high G+C Gram-positive bacteria)]|nr:16S rRNA (guanine(527)-N(7))-methyltransferase RsmG [Rothia sp. (in: high G+C Gram-positive bacteria)]
MTSSDFPVLTGTDLTAAQKIFSTELGLAQRYVEHLASSGIERGLLGPRGVPRLWARHVLNCAVVQEAIDQESRVVDVGSGAGLPGLCLAISRPDLSLTLVEPLERRVIWLEEVVHDLGLKNVTIIRSRAEQLAGTLDADYVTARAVSALSSLVDITLPILRGRGELLAIKGQSAEQEITKAQKKLDKYGVRQVAVLKLGVGILEQATTVVQVKL